jgi:hypothetical protein
MRAAPPATTARSSARADTGWRSGHRGAVTPLAAEAGSLAAMDGRRR